MKALAYSFYGLNDSVQRLVGSLLPIALLSGAALCGLGLFQGWPYED